MRDVGDELASLALGFRQGVGHVVEGRRQLADLVAAAGVLHAHVEVSGGIGPGGLDHLPDGLNLAHGGQGAGHKGDQQDDGRGHEEQADEGAPHAHQGPGVHHRQDHAHGAAVLLGDGHRHHELPEVICAADAAAALVKALVPENGVLNLLGDGHHLASQPFIRGQQGVALVVAQEKVRLGKPGGQGDEILQAGAGGLPVGGQIVPGHIGNELRVLAHFAAPLGHGVVIAQGVKRHAQQQKRQQHHARRQQELLPIETVEPAAEPGDLFLAHFTSNL